MKERKKSNELGTYFVYRVIESIQELNFRLGIQDEVRMERPQGIFTAFEGSFLCLK